jgi:hypothetical protein
MRERLDKWRAAQPIRRVECANPLCRKEFETQFGIYCCTSCKSKASWLRKRAQTIESLGEVGCGWCGEKLDNPLKKKFCSGDHKWRFFAAKRAGRPIKVRVEPGLVIETRRYDAVEQVRREWREKRSRPRMGG